MIKVLFVCLGNICRSPMAEAVFLHKVRTLGLDGNIRADSAGTGDWHAGAALHHGTRSLLDANGIDYSHAARVLTSSDFDEFDLILTMDEDNYRAVARRGKGKAEVRRLMDFAPQSEYREVPDPYYNGNFALTYQLVSEAADGVIAYLRASSADGAAATMAP